MFDLAAKDGSVRVKSASEPPDYGKGGEKKPPAAAHPLDSGKMQRLHKSLLSQYERELDRQRANRTQMALDEAFYDNEQWSEEDIATLEERGQVPLVYNVISATVDWVTGTERRGRTDFKVLPRKKEDGGPATRKSELLKYLSDVNKTSFGISRAFDDTVKAGIGWLEDGIDQSGEKEPIYSRYESWRYILHDSTATTLNLEDARYIIRAKWVDLDVAMAMFPDRAGILKSSVDADNSFAHVDYFGDEAMDEQEDTLDNYDGSYATSRSGFERPRVRLIEMWYRQPGDIDRMRGGAFDGELFDEYGTGHIEEVHFGKAQVKKARGMRMHVAIFTADGMLTHQPSPYRHNDFPFTPIWGYRRGKDGLPYGMIRRLRGMQEDVNKRASKALHILSTSKIIMDDKALPEGTTVEEFIEEAHRPDAVLIKTRGSEMEIDADRELSQYHIELMSRSIELIQSASGVTDENLGRKTNAVSGVAIGRRQDQGSLASARFFDNLRLSRQLQGEKQVSLVEQYMPEKKSFRITNTRGKPDYPTINDGTPENDIVRSKADYIISEQDWQNSMREAAVAELMELFKTLPPEVALALLDLVVDEMDLKNRDEIVKRIRALTGQQDPDAEEDSPEAMEQKQAKDASAQFEQEMATAGLDKLKSDAAKNFAAAKKLIADITAIETRQVTEKVSAQNTALDAAQKVLVAPATADIADVITHEAGLESRSDLEQQAAAAAQAAPPQQQQLPSPPIVPGE